LSSHTLHQNRKEVGENVFEGQTDFSIKTFTFFALAGKRTLDLSLFHLFSDALPLSQNGSPLLYTGNTEGGSITVPLTSCLTGLESAV
jgi:hypothetical protein